MLDERRLDFGRRDPLPRDLEHVVAAALVGEIAVGVDVVLVAGDVPVALERGLRLLVLVPVVGGARVTGNPEVSRLSPTELFAIVVDDLRAIAGNRCAARAALRLARVVRDEDVQHLRRTDPVKDLEAEAGLPLLEQRLRQGFAGAHTHPQRGQVIGEAFRRIREERRVESRGGKQDRRLLLRDEAVHQLGRRPLGFVDRGRTGTEREEHAVAEPVSVEER